VEIVFRNGHQFYALYKFSFENQGILRIGFAQILSKGGSPLCCTNSVTQVVVSIDSMWAVLLQIPKRIKGISV
jgi:hypothetical protein